MAPPLLALVAAHESMVPRLGLLIGNQIRYTFLEKAVRRKSWPHKALPNIA